MRKLSLSAVRMSLIGAGILLSVVGVGWVVKTRLSSRPSATASDVSLPSPEPQMETTAPKEVKEVRKKVSVAESPSRDVSAEVVDGATKSKLPPKTALEVIDRFLAEMEGPEGQIVDPVKIMGRLQQLRDFGEEGSKAILEFLRTRQDIDLAGPGGLGSGPINGRMGQFASVRTALLEALYEMNDPTAQSANLEVLQSSSSGTEILLAARNLEKASPGTYRGVAIKAATEILAKPPDSNDPMGQAKAAWANYQVMEVLGYYQAKEAIPEVEDLVKKQPALLPTWMNALLKFSPEDQRASMQHLLGDANTRKAIVENNNFLSQMDFQDAESRKLVREVMEKDMSVRQKEIFLQNITQSAYYQYRTQLMKPEEAGAARQYSPPKARIEGALRFLDEIAPQMENPILKQRLDTTRKQLEAQLQNAR